MAFKLNGYERQDNRAAASERSDPDRWMQNFESWGRVDGFNVLFTNGTGDFIDSTVHVYRTEAAARDAFRRELGGSLRYAANYLQGMGAKIALLDELRLPTIGLDHESLEIGHESITLHAQGYSPVTGPTCGFRLDRCIVPQRQRNIICGTDVLQKWNTR